MVFEYDYDSKTAKMRINCMGSIYGSSLEDSSQVMSYVIKNLLEAPKTASIVLTEAREHEYSYDDTRLLTEIAEAILEIKSKKFISLKNLTTPDCESESAQRYSALQNFLTQLMYDPVDAFKDLRREIRHLEVRLKRGEIPEPQATCARHYMQHALLPTESVLVKSKLIQVAEGREKRHGDRAFYREVFHPSMRPNFMFTKYISIPPANAEPIDRYEVGENRVEIYKVPGKIRSLYHVVPPEFNLNEDEYSLLDATRRYLGEHKPREMELADPEKVRENFYNIGKDLLVDMAEKMNMHLTQKKIDRLANILTRYTAGLGVIELLLQDDKIQDVSINSPVSMSPIFIFHADHEECETNLVASREDAESWATRFRLQSGRPLDEANPVLDTEIDVPGGRARVAAITRFLSPEGLGFALRRHRDKPWTFPLFVSNRMFNPLAAGLLWFFIDGARTMLVAGTRSSGKSSFLGAMMIQIMPNTRIISVEDTLELPIPSMRKLGYNVERLKSRSVITRIETEISSEEALRTALRLGDSSLIIGEVRSKEAKALYEAMRIGALANVVAGTIHGDSAYGVFDRVVNDLGVPPTSFKATDIIIIANRLKSSDGLHSFRRLTEITEVRKHWQKDPSAEAGFQNLMEYSAKTDELKPTETLLTGESIILNDIADRVREWKGNWDLVWNNINLRANIVKTISDTSAKLNNPKLLEAEFVLQSNSQYHIIADKVRQEIGAIDNKMVFEKWLEWLKTSVQQ